MTKEELLSYIKSKQGHTFNWYVQSLEREGKRPQDLSEFHSLFEELEREDKLVIDYRGHAKSYSTKVRVNYRKREEYIRD